MIGAPMIRSRLRAIGAVIPSISPSLVPLLLLLFGSTQALAAGKRVGIPRFEGKQEALVRKKVMQAVKAHGYVLVKSREMGAAIASTGTSLDSEDGLKTLAKELALTAIITGEVGPRRAKIVVHDGGDGSALGDASFAGASPRKVAVAVGRDFWRKLGADVGKGHLPSGSKKEQKAAVAEAPEDNEESADTGGDEAPEAKTKGEPAESSESASDEGEKAPPSDKKKEKPKTEAPPEEAQAPSEPATPSGLPWLDVGVQVGGINRALSYNQNQSVLAPYTLGLGPVVDAKVIVYPIAPFLAGWVEHLGVEAQIEQGFGISSSLAGGGKYGNVVHDFGGGLRYRIPFAGGQELDVSATGGEHAFTFTSTSTGNRATLTTLPDTIYHYLRGGVGVRVPLPAGFSVSVAGGYRYIFNKGGTEISSRNFFPHLTVMGADADVVVGYTINPSFEVRATGSFRRYWYSMHSVVADRGVSDIAGGAVDQYLVFTGGIAYLFGGGASKSEPAGEEPPPPPAPKAKSRHSSDSDSDSADDDSKGGDKDKTSGDKGKGKGSKDKSDDDDDDDK
jgi:hypothetical protein